MIIQKIINISPEFKTKIDIIKIYIILIISLIVTILLLSNDIFYYKLCSKIILIYVSIDIFFSKKDSIIHHIFCYFLCSYITFNNVDVSINSIIYKTILQTETSTIFYMFRLIIDLYKNEIEKSRFNKIIKYYSYLNDIMFIILFYKLRINDYFYNVIQNDNMYFLINLYNKNSFIENTKVCIGIYGLFTLNLYWFMIMFKKLYKQFVVNNKLSINSLAFSEYILKYTFYINLLIGLNYYIKNYNKYLLFDLIGIFTLSIASGNYHGSKYNYILDFDKKYEEKDINKDKDLNKDINKEIVFDITTKQLLLPFIYDKYTIQMRSLFALITIFLIKNNNKFYVSIIYNSISLFFININIINLLLENNKLIYDNSEESKKMILKFDLLSSIPYLLDIITIIYVSDTIIQKTNLIVITILLGLTLFIKPFYNLNHILLHTLLIIQTICIIKCVLNVDYL